MASRNFYESFHIGLFGKEKEGPLIAEVWRKFQMGTMHLSLGSLRPENVVRGVSDGFRQDFVTDGALRVLKEGEGYRMMQISDYTYLVVLHRHSMSDDHPLSLEGWRVMFFFLRPTADQLDELESVTRKAATALMDKITGRELGHLGHTSLEER